jgi:hypothetical protein
MGLGRDRVEEWRVGRPCLRLKMKEMGFLLFGLIEGKVDQFGPREVGSVG